VLNCDEAKATLEVNPSQRHLADSTSDREHYQASFSNGHISNSLLSSAIGKSFISYALSDFVYTRSFIKDSPHPQKK